MSPESQDVYRAKQEIGGRLAAVREAAGLDDSALAERLGWQLTKIADLQRGRRAPSESDIREWTAACGEPQTAGELAALMHDPDRRHVGWRGQLQTGHAPVQRAWREAEAAALAVRCFENSHVPGLLQTADYARAVLRQYAKLHRSPLDTDASVEARLARQQGLEEPSDRQRHLVLSEAALRQGAAPPSVMRAQIDRLVAATTLPAITLGVVPLHKQQSLVPAHGFCIFDDRMVTVEIYSAELRLGLPEEVALYRRAFDTLAADAHYGEDARRLLRAAAGSWV
ncbi:helix-turn-helix domain-containing protein [Streptomyces harbinensis]